MNFELLHTLQTVAKQQHTNIILVGGAIRDWLLGKPVHDYDIAVQGDGIRLGRAIANRLGGAFYVMDAERGTARVILADTVIDFAICRGATWDADLRARDFTINAIGLNLKLKFEGLNLTPTPSSFLLPHASFIIDPLNGIHDLRQKLIRMCAPTSISDDPVRALRAVRMATTLNADFAPETHTAIQNVQLMNGQVSIERLRDELMKMLALTDALSSVQKLLALGLLPQLLPNVLWQIDSAVHQALRPISGLDPALHHQLQQITSNERTRLAILRLVVLLLHTPPKTATKIADSLRLSSDEMAQIRHTVRQLPNTPIAEMLAANGIERERLLYRLSRKAGNCAPELLWLAQLQQPQWDTQPLIARYFERYAPSVMPPPLIQGGDLMAMGHTPGPMFGRILEAVREAQMIGQINTIDEAMLLVKNLEKD